VYTLIIIHKNITRDKYFCVIVTT